VEFGGREVAAAALLFAAMFRRRQVVEHPGDIAAVEPQHGMLELDRFGIVPLHQAARDQAKVLHRLGLKRVHHGHRQAAILSPQGENIVLADQLGRHQADDLAADRDLRQVDLLDAHLDRQRLVELGLRDVAQFEKDLAETAVRDFLFGQSHSQAGLIKVRLLAQQFADPLSFDPVA